jgi:hypothetical protein
MWYFIVHQPDVTMAQFRALQQLATQTEAETFNEPFDNLYIFGVERDQYSAFADKLDREGVVYQSVTTQLTRAELLEEMKK